MRGPSKSPPKYRKHKGTGQAIVTLCGKDIYLGKYGSAASKREFDRLIGEWLANGRSLTVTGRMLTVTELVARYWQFAKGYYTKNGQPTDEQAGVKAAVKPLKTVYGKTYAAEFGPLALEAVRETMIKTGNSRRYINQNIGRIKRMFRWGVSKELIPVEVYQRLATVAGLRKGKTQARETNPILPVDDETIEKTISNLANPVVADMIRFQRLTGCRPGELMTIKPCDVERDSVKGVCGLARRAFCLGQHRSRRGLSF